MSKVNIKEKFSLIDNYWDPKIIGEVNDMHVKIAKVKGEFDWHLHKDEDEMFLVIEGELLLKYRDKEELLKKGEMAVVSKGVEHKPVADQETMIEQKGTLNTGNVSSEKTVDEPEWI